MSSERQEQPADLREQLALLMRGLGTRTVLYQQFVAASHGLYNNDLKSVDILRETGPITAGELSKITGLATGTITSLIDRLEKCGYVRRENDPADLAQSHYRSGIRAQRSNQKHVFASSFGDAGACLPVFGGRAPAHHAVHRQNEQHIGGANPSSQRLPRENLP